MHKDHIDFPNFCQNANFPNSMGLGPIPKKVCESPAISLCIDLILAILRNVGF